MLIQYLFSLSRRPCRSKSCIFASVFDTNSELSAFSWNNTILFEHICWNIYFCNSTNSNVQTFDISISIVSKTCLILPTWRLRFALFKNSISTTYLHPIVLFQRNKILPKVCYVCFLLSETKILMLGQILSYLPPVEMWEDLSQLSKLFPKLLILSLMNPLLEHVTW